MTKKQKNQVDEKLNEQNLQQEEYNEQEIEEMIDDTNQEVIQNNYLEALQRLQAEFENYRKRNESLAKTSKEDGVIYAVNKLLPVLDSFKSAKSLVTDEEFLNSLNLIEKQFISGLENLNITKIDALGQIFNPNLHNAVLTGKDETKPEDEILEVYQDGYKLNDKVIRFSVVKINKI